MFMLSEKERIARMSPPPGKIRLVIDTDAKNELDDQFAIAWAAASTERFHLEALYAVPFSHACFQKLDQDRDALDQAAELNGHSQSPADGMEQSYDEIIRILSLMNIDPRGRVFRGSDRYLPSRTEPVASEAALDLIRRSRAAEEPLYVAAIGALTNIASALLMAPEIADRIVLVWLGGHEPAWGHGIEFNLIQDVYAAQAVLESGVPMIWIPCSNVASHLTVSQAELTASLLGRGPVCDALSRPVLAAFQNPAAEIAMMRLLRTSTMLENCDQGADYLAQFPTAHVAFSRIIWDVSAVAALKNPNWTPSKLIPVPVLTDDFRWVPGPEPRRLIRQVTYCYRNFIFFFFFSSLAGK